MGLLEQRKALPKSVSKFALVFFLACLWFGVGNGKSEEDFECAKEGSFLDPRGDLCRDYFQCFQIQGQWFYGTLSCEGDTVFDGEALEVCVPGECSEDASTTPTTEITTNGTSTTTTPMPSTTPTSTTTSTSTSTPPPPSTPTLTTPGRVEFECTAAGYFGDPYECSIFHACIENWGGWVKYVMDCPSGLVFCSPNCGYPSECPWLPCLKQTPEH